MRDVLDARSRSTAPTPQSASCWVSSPVLTYAAFRDESGNEHRAGTRASPDSLGGTASKSTAHKLGCLSHTRWPEGDCDDEGPRPDARCCPRVARAGAAGAAGPVDPTPCRYPHRTLRSRAIDRVRGG